MSPSTESTDPFYTDTLPDRSRRLLAVLVRKYIEQGEPISSLWLAEHGGFRVSSATVRHIMVKLEEAGYVYRPHTSAGRVPTDLGYRCYVNQILQERRPVRPAPTVEALFTEATTVEDFLSNVSQELSRVSRHLGFAVAPTGKNSTFKHIDFMPLEGNEILIVLIMANGQISHKTVHLEKAFRPFDLTQSANYLNTEFSGLTLTEVRLAIEKRLRHERTLYDKILSLTLLLANRAFSGISPQNSLFIQGASKLLGNASKQSERVPLSALRALFTMIEERHRLLRLLNEYIESPGLTIVIGTEHTTADLKDLSLIAATYFDGEQIGSVGVIGPRRMHYSRAIAAVDRVSCSVSRILFKNNGSIISEHVRRN